MGVVFSQIGSVWPSNFLLNLSCVDFGTLIYSLLACTLRYFDRLDYETLRKFATGSLLLLTGIFMFQSELGLLVPVGSVRNARDGHTERNYTTVGKEIVLSSAL